MTKDDKNSHSTIPPCKNNSGKNSTRSYPLTLNEWQFCYDINNKSDVDNIITKAHQIPPRLHHILVDIVAFQSNNALADQIDWTKIWKDLTTLQPRPTARIVDDSGLPHGPNANSNNQRNFGLELGRIIRFLCESGDGNKPLVLKGFIRGLMIDESKKVNLKDVRDEQVQYEFNAKPDSGKNIVHPDNEKSLESVHDMLPEIKNQLEHQSYLSELEQRQLSKSIQAIQFPSKCIATALEAVNITSTPYIYQLIDDEIEFDRRLVPRPESKREKRLDEAKKIAEEIEKSECIKTVEELADLISSDTEELRNEKGNKGWIIFRYIASKDTSVSKSQIRENTSISHENISYLLDKMAGEKEQREWWLRGQQWSDRPIIRETGNDDWTTTPLGEIIYTICYRTTTLNPDSELPREKIVEELQKHVLDNEYELSSADKWLDNLSSSK